MTREEAIKRLKEYEQYAYGIWHNDEEDTQAFRMAIEALQTDVVRCKDCKHQDECEELVLFNVNDDEVMGHRLHWCSYGERKGGDDE